MSASELEALVDEAHAAGLEVTAHAQEHGVRRSLAAGVDELAHMPCGQAPPEVMREAARRGVAIVATLDVYGGAAC